MKKCPICDGLLNREDKVVVYNYKDHTKELIQSGDYCMKCKEGFLSPKDLKVSQKSIADFRRKVDHLLSTDEVRAIRKKLKLTQEKASSLFGGGIRAFYKYETGENAQSKPLDILLKLVDSGKLSMDDIQAVS